LFISASLKTQRGFEWSLISTDIWMRVELPLIRRKVFITIPGRWRLRLHKLPRHFNNFSSKESGMKVAWLTVQYSLYVLQTLYLRLIRRSSHSSYSFWFEEHSPASQSTFCLPLYCILLFLRISYRTWFDLMSCLLGQSILLLENFVVCFWIKGTQTTILSHFSCYFAWQPRKNINNGTTVYRKCREVLNKRRRNLPERREKTGGDRLRLQEKDSKDWHKDRDEWSQRRRRMRI
jgi:hypothetical protein